MKMKKLNRIKLFENFTETNADRSKQIESALNNAFKNKKISFTIYPCKATTYIADR